MEDLTPLYNKEFYLAYLCGEDVVLPIPDGNAERYLAYLCGMDVTIPDVPDGRTETYLAYKCGEDVVLPDPMYRIEFYLAKWCGIDCEVPEPMYRIEYWLAQLANSGELKTVTGNPISVSDALAKPAESLTIEILPQQSGSGDPSPDNVRPISGFTGVNIYHESAYDAGASPKYTIDWTSSAGTVYGGTLDVTTGVLTVDRAMIQLVTGSDNGIAQGKQQLAYAVPNKKPGLDNFMSNIFKIGNMSDNYSMTGRSATSTVEFRIALSDLGLTGEESSSVRRDAFISWLNENPTYVCYELATPQTIQLTPTEIEMLLGNNVIWNDVGDMVLEYLADGPADDIDALQILLNNRYVNNGEPDEATDKEALEILLGGNTR